MRLCLFALFVLAACQHQHEHGHHHHHTPLKPFQTQIVEQKGQAKADYGDSLLLYFSLQRGGEYLVNTAQEGRKVSLVLPTKMYRNHLEEPLTLIGLGDSLLVKLVYDSTMLEFAALAPKLRQGDQLLLGYRLVEHYPRTQLQAKLDTAYAQAKGFPNIGSLKTEQQQVRSRAKLLQDSLSQYLKAQMAQAQPKLHRQWLEAPQAAAQWQAGDSIWLYYILLLPNGRVLDNTLVRGDRFLLTWPPQGSLKAFWEQALPQMPVGSSAFFYIPPQLGYGPAGIPPTVPPNSSLGMYIQVVQGPR